MTETYHKIEKIPWSDVQDLHFEKITDQLRYLDKNSDYYSSKFSEWEIDPMSVTTLEEFREIPFTAKDEERQNQADPSPEQPLGEHQAVRTEELNRTISSSGTTGKPTYFGLTEPDRHHWSEVIERCFYTAGIRPSDTVIYGAGHTMIPGGVPYFEGVTRLGANAVPAGGGSTERLLSAVDDLYGDVLFTTTSHHRYLTEHAPEILGHDVHKLSISKLVGGGGPGISNPKIRNRLYKEWDVEQVREVMGVGDIIGCMWAECSAEDGMHYCAQGHAHVELIDPETGENVGFEDGAEGELVYTSLGREATPLLRFRSGDYVRITGTACSCGRTSPKMQCIGRADDMLIYKGMNVFPSAIRDVASDVDGTLPHIRVVLPEKEKVHFEDPIPVNVVLDPESSRDLEEIVSEVRTQLQARIQPAMVSVDDIELSEYKSKLVTIDD